MFRLFWKRFGRARLAVAALLAAARLASAQDLPAIPQPPVPLPTPTPPVHAGALGAPTLSSNAADELTARIERLEKQNQDLLDALKVLQTRQAPAPADPVLPAAVQPVAADQNAAVQPNTLRPQDVGQLIDQYMQQKEQQMKAAEKAKANEPYKVGTDLRMLATWKDGVFFETPHKDFYVHIGGEMQYDTLWFSQDPSLEAAKGKAPVGKRTTGDSTGGVGELADSTDFRRLRLWAEGGFWEVGEFMFQPKFEKIVNGTVGIDEMWVGVKDIPFLGTIRVGHHKTPQGLESDDWSSNMTFTYMERSTMSTAFFQNFGTGVVATNNILSDLIGQRATYAAMFYKPQDGESGAQYADGDYAFTGRLSGVLIDQNNGRHLMHVALSATYRHNKGGTATVSAQPEMFDFNGGDNGFGTATTAGAGGPAITNESPTIGNAFAAGANNSALVSTGAITSTAETVFGSEFLYIRGPFSIQAEYAALTFVDSIGAGGMKGNTGDLTVHGGYVALSYILTGENRTYDYRLGRLGTNYLSPTTPFWLVKDGNGGFNTGWGAWEAEARFSHLDLNTKDINGGQTDAVNIGLVWHLNNNLRVTFDYLRQNRYDLPKGVNSGWLDGFGIRTQLQF